MSWRRIKILLKIPRQFHWNDLFHVEGSGTVVSRSSLAMRLCLEWVYQARGGSGLSAPKDGEKKTEGNRNWERRCGEETIIGDHRKVKEKLTKFGTKSIFVVSDLLSYVKFPNQI